MYRKSITQSLMSTYSQNYKFVCYRISFRTGLHCFVWSESVSRPWQELYVCHMNAAFLWCLIWCPNFWIFFWEKNPPTYQPIGEMEGQVQETNRFVRVALVYNFFFIICATAIKYMYFFLWILHIMFFPFNCIFDVDVLCQ